MSLLAGLDLVTGVVHARVEERHRSREFVDLLKQIDAAHAPATAIKLLVDNHCSHKSKETRAWLGKQPKGRFAFTFLPKHGSWLNLIEGFFSKLTRSVLRQRELLQCIFDNAAVDLRGEVFLLQSWINCLAEKAIIADGEHTNE